jgi:hypothetical protein
MSLDDRKDAFEKKYAHDQELMFKVEARTCKLFGLWVAEQIGLTGADAETYAKEVVSANLEEAGFDDVKRKVVPDLQAKGKDVSDHILDRQLEIALEEAQRQLTQN